MGNLLAQDGFRMITLASESQALRHGVAEHLHEATGQAGTGIERGGYN